MGGRAGSRPRDDHGEEDRVTFGVAFVRRADEEYQHALDRYLVEAPHEIERFEAEFDVAIARIPSALSSRESSTGISGTQRPACSRTTSGTGSSRTSIWWRSSRCSTRRRICRVSSDAEGA